MSWPPLLLLLLALSQGATPARILGLFPYRGASHFYVFQPLMEALADRGHDVTVVSHLPRSKPYKNYRDISVADTQEPTVGFHGVGEFREEMFTSNVIGLHVLAQEYDRVFALPQVLALVNSTFDLVFVEMFNSDLFFSIAYKIGAPVIGFSSCSLMPWTADSMAVPNLPAYLPNNLADRGPQMPLWERTLNTLEVWASRVYYRLFIHPEAQRLAEKLLGPLPDLADIAANTSMLFVNSHFSYLGQRPLPQSVIEVGGISVRPAKHLPKELDKKLNESSGAVYFSFGSVLLGSSLPKDKHEAFLSVFSSLEKTVLWKREADLEQPRSNIITRAWFPQRDVLAHKKVELFISHCGLLGLTEAVYSGVPILCLPFYGDQPMNARYVQDIGIGLKLDFFTLTSTELQNAVTQLLNNATYAKRAREVSRASRDRPMQALESAIYWSEYLLRHGTKALTGAQHHLPLWRREGLDVGIVLLLLLLVLVLSPLVLIMYALKLLCLRFTSPAKTKAE